MSKSIEFTINDDGSTNLRVDPKVGISELASLIVILGYQCDRMLDAQQAAAHPGKIIAIPSDGMSDVAREILAGRNGN